MSHHTYRSPRKAPLGVLSLTLMLLGAWFAVPMRGHISTASATGPTGPDLDAAVAYLTAPTQLIDGTHAESFPGFADVGLTTDIAYSLAATGTADDHLAAITAWLNANSATYTGIGTPYAAGGSTGKIALLAEITGHDPTDFGGGDLIATIEDTRCAAPEPSKGCIATGGYAFTPSTFAQTLAMMATWRGGDRTTLTEPAALLEAMQNTDGSFPSVLRAPGTPPSGIGAMGEVDSTAMAAMTLALMPGAQAANATSDAIAWIASTQHADGGFPGASGNSVNSAALAIQAMRLDPTAYAAPIAAAETFLAANQNTDGGFRIAADPGLPPGSDLRASAQAVTGAVGISFALLDRPVGPNAPVTTTSTPVTSTTLAPSTSVTTTPTTTAPPTSVAETTTTESVSSDVHAQMVPLDDSSRGSGPATGSGRGGSLPMTGVDARWLLGSVVVGLTFLVAGCFLVARKRTT